MTRKLIVVISDTHCGSRLALLNPQTTLSYENENGEKQEQKVVLTEAQNYLWDLYMWAMSEVVKIAGNDPIHLIHLGDEIEGNKFHTHLVSSRIDDQITIAVDVLKVWFSLPNLKSVRLVAGTPSHNFGEGASTRLVHKILSVMSSIDVKVLYHGLLDVDGVLIDYAHHGPSVGMRLWLEGNNARFYLRDIMLTEISAGKKPPDIVLRGHYHRPTYEYLELMSGKYASHLYVLPSWSLINDYTRQVSSSAYINSHGLLVLEIVDGKFVNSYRFYNTLDLRTKEILDDAFNT